ncbi:hypothetical protein PV11_02894 [Exophiala sideris]|uniref:Uncharacterized protein n=1 Tax=Exophiala sideris TaxID=1016849 RepID=A0A0D1YXL7_9EURO|nr:hypothetical protein PV11_02894 [Exophiala sideris]
MRDLKTVGKLQALWQGLAFLLRTLLEEVSRYQSRIDTASPGATRKALGAAQITLVARRIMTLLVDHSGLWILPGFYLDFLRHSCHHQHSKQSGVTTTSKNDDIVTQINCLVE